MKKNLLSTLALGLISIAAFSQNVQNSTPMSRRDSLAGFNSDSCRNLAIAAGIEQWEQDLFVKTSENRYLRNKYGINQRGNPPVVIPQTPCTNMGFETGDFSGWTGFIGDNTVNSLGPLQNIVPGIFTGALDPAVTDASARHSIMTTGAANDPCGNFIAVPGGYGNYTCRLGNSTANYQGEAIEQTFVVDPNNTQFTYRYACVLYDGSHPANEQPYFMIQVMDSLGNPVNACAQYYVAAGTSNVGFTSCGNQTWYRPWTTVSFDLSAFANQSITVRFTAAGCIWSGHYAYAYIDASCSSIADAVSATFCPGSPGAFLVAPAGFGDYQWFYPNGSPIVGATNDSLFVPNAVTGDTFSVEMHAIADTSCVTVLNVVVQLTLLQTQVTAIDPICHNETNGSATASCANCVPPVTYLWNTIPAQGTATASNLGFGTYLVNYTDSIGCIEQDTVTLINPPRLDTSAITTQFCYGDPNITLVAVPGMPGYQWLDAQGNPIAGATSQTYFVTSPQLGDLYYCVYDLNPCDVTDSIILTYVPPSPLFSPDSLVNIFTPNGDGKNDFFYPYFDQTVYVQAGGNTQPAYDFTLLYIGEYEIWIYDRWGVEVFNSADYTIGWDGNIFNKSGKEATEGVYFFVVKYKTRCYRENEEVEPIMQKGFVHLKR